MPLSPKSALTATLAFALGVLVIVPGVPAAAATKGFPPSDTPFMIKTKARGKDSCATRQPDYPKEAALLLVACNPADTAQHFVQPSDGAQAGAVYDLKGHCLNMVASLRQAKVCADHKDVAWGWKQTADGKVVARKYPEHHWRVEHVGDADLLKANNGGLAAVVDLVAVKPAS
ncbi:hypothetical protein ACWGB8_27780 [Kitasatospora sp. NPDC054939]